MATDCLGPVSAALFAALNVSALTSLTPGGISDSLQQSGAFPRIWFEVFERENRGLGNGSMPEVRILIHIFSKHEGGKEAHAIASQVMALLRDQPLTAAGYAQAGLVFWDSTDPLGDTEIAATRCRELLMTFRTYVEES